jgi:hypothetical protein
MQNYNSKFKNLRSKYRRFIYHGYSYRVFKGNLEILFDFKIEPGIYFRPKVIIENIDKFRIKTVSDGVLNNLVFHLGLMEIPSYWKATCSPEIEIKAGFLNKEQINWWKELILKGMGQFFYENKIDFLRTSFLKILSNFSPKNTYTTFSTTVENSVLVPIGGGKDSVVTLEILKKAGEHIQCFSLNPTEAALKIMKIACQKPIIVRRTIDEKLLELNRRGFLNGHTPFSAYLAFLSVLVATIFCQKYIAFSNERSSNEGNVKYLGKVINHQWSKSFEFEQKFREYSQKYLTPGVEYFSFLRPLYEIQIAKLFSRYPQYFNAFLSCNEAYRTYSGTKLPTKKWCGECPKCLFVFASLYPFVETKKLIKIFRKNLFEDKNLLSLMLQLIGERKFKPFECVGTKKESLIAFYLSYKKYKENPNQKMPFLLKQFEERILNYLRPRISAIKKRFLRGWSNQHYLPKKFEKILESIFSSNFKKT